MSDKSYQETFNIYTYIYIQLKKSIVLGLCTHSTHTVQTTFALDFWGD